jgi:tetratricopeptide (TPR) repeat protein/predicted Ser/Thr protein kinase
LAISAGEVISGRYKVVRLIAEGGFGAVYLAQDNRLGNKVVALKESFDQTPAAQEQFRLEAQLLANLQHAGLPRVTDYFLLPDGRQFLVMDYIEGRDLDQLVIDQGHPLPERQAATLLAQVCEAVAYLHTRRPQPIIHRDIKPANIKITPQGHAILVDFGIAKLYHPMKGTAKVAKAVTKHFSPPEQHIGKTDTRSDVYSLGATIYFATCLSLPPDAMERLNQGALVTSPARVNPSISAELDHIIVKCLELNPDDRFANANRLAAALRSFLANRPVVYEAPGIVCPRCGWGNRAGAKFCVRDGTPLAGRSALGAAGKPSLSAAPAAAPPLPAEMLFEMANAFAAKKDYAQAIPRYEACLRQGFSDQAAFYNLAAAYLEAQRPADAVRTLEEGLRRHPRDAQMQTELALAYRAQNLPEKALAAAAQAVQIDPGDAEALCLYGELLLDAGRYREAIGQLEKSLTIDPGSYTGQLSLGRAYGELGELKKAGNVLNRAARLELTRPDPYIWMGVFFVRARKYREAVIALESALQVDPKAVAAQAWLGEAWMQQSQYQKALPYLKQATALNPGDAAQHARLGQCYAQLKQRTEARASFNKALQLDPGYQLAREWLKKI